MKRKLLAICTIFIMGAALSCGDDPPSASGKDWLDDVAYSDVDDVGVFDTGVTDTGHADVRPLDDVSTDVDDEEDDATQPQNRTLDDYRRCFGDSDCPVGLGSCIKEVALNRADVDGAQSVAINEIFAQLQAGEGICTFVCTNNPNVCESLSVNGNMSDPAPHVCQLVVQGEAPYPEAAPAFPFDTALDPASQAAGQPFGSICRPPFELHAAVAGSMCERCVGPNSCGGNDAICWSLLNKAAAGENEAGTCLSACSADDQCALGFVCDVTAEEGGQGFCRPTLDTCTSCRDLDGDGFGTGRCSHDEFAPVTPHDCDDTNPLAYFAPRDMAHPFPVHCGVQDFNCNGLSDDVEQIGADNYPVEHCTACFDTCEGELPNGQLACQNRGSLEAPQPACVAKCDLDANGKMLFADCDGDVSNGCETPTDDISRQYYRDSDGDGYGDPNDVLFACSENVAPAGYVSNNLDCDDKKAAINPDALEVCDGADNNCNGEVDDVPGAGAVCNTGVPGVCSAGTRQCPEFTEDEIGTQKPLICAPKLAPGVIEICGDQLDNNCNGKTDENWPQDGTVPPAFSNYKAYYRDADGDGYPAAGAEPLYACTKPVGYILQRSDGKEDCDDYRKAVNPGATEICNGIDDNCNGLIDDADPSVMGKKTFYRDNDGDGYGRDSTTYNITACVRPSGYADKAGDCDDTNANIKPGATDLCDGVDNNCDGKIDEDYPLKGNSCSAGIGECKKTATRVCSDNGKATECRAEPGVSFPEKCDGKDNNCNNKTDEGCPVDNSNAEINGILFPRGEIGVIYNHTDQRTYSCGKDEAMIGAYVYQEVSTSYDDIQRIGLYCKKLEVLHDTNYNYNIKWVYPDTSYSYVPGPKYSYKTYKERAAGGFVCEPGSVISEVNIRKKGHHFPWISFTCRGYDVNTTEGLAAVTTTITPKLTSGIIKSYGNSSKGTLMPPFKCESNEVAVGFQAAPDKQDGDSDALTYLALQCRKISIKTIGAN